LQSPSLSQLWQPVVLPLVPQHLDSLHDPDEHWDEEEQEAPSDFFATTHCQLESVYPELQLLQSPSLSQLWQPVVLPLVPQHLDSLHDPDEHWDE
jgi:hypothetical protein